MEDICGWLEGEPAMPSNRAEGGPWEQEPLAVSESNIYKTWGHKNVNSSSHGPMKVLNSLVIRFQALSGLFCNQKWCYKRLGWDGWCRLCRYFFLVIYVWILHRKCWGNGSACRRDVVWEPGGLGLTWKWCAPKQVALRFRCLAGKWGNAGSFPSGVLWGLNKIIGAKFSGTWQCVGAVALPSAWDTFLDAFPWQMPTLDSGLCWERASLTVLLKLAPPPSHNCLSCLGGFFPAGLLYSDAY